MRLLLLLLFICTPLFAQEGVWYKSLEEALVNPEHVYQLQLKRKRLTVFPVELRRFPNLQKLDLSKNKIKAFPDSLSDLSNLIFLDLSRNDIDEIPVHISQLTSLQQLDLWDNYINVLPEQIKELKSLNFLDIRGVALSYHKYISYKEMMKGVELFMSEPCDCQE